MTKNNLIFILSFLSSMLLLGYVSKSYFGKFPQMTTKKNIRIAVANTPLTAPFMVAKHLRLFAAHGLDVELVPCQIDQSCADALITQQADYATFSEHLLVLQAYQFSELALLVSFVESANDLKLLSLDGLAVKQASDLQGKRVGVVQGSASEFYFESVLTANNIDRANIEIQYLPPEQLVTALLAYQLDAISVWEPHGYQANLYAAGGTRNVGLPGIYQRSFNLVSTRPYTQLHQNESEIIIQVLQQSVLWINRNPDRTIKLLSHMLQVPEHQIKWSWQDYMFRLSIGNALLSNLRLQSQWAQSRKLVSGPTPDFRAIIIREPFDNAYQTELTE